MSRNLCFISLFLLLLLASCKKGVLGSEGEMITLDRPAAPFTQIILKNNVSLVLTQDTIEKISVTAPSRIEPYIKTTINAHTLTISNENAGKLIPPGEQITVSVSVKDLARIDYVGSGNITSTNTIQKDYFNFIASDASGYVSLQLNTSFTLVNLYGDMAVLHFTGQSDSCYTYAAAAGTVDFRDFKVKRMQMDYSGVRDAYIWPSELLNARIFYRGNIYYRGNPLITRAQATGEGKFFSF